MNLPWNNEYEIKYSLIAEMKRRMIFVALKAIYATVGSFIVS